MCHGARYAVLVYQPEPQQSHPELGTDRIVRFVTQQAPAPQALIFLGGAREGEEGRVLY